MLGIIALLPFNSVSSSIFPVKVEPKGYKIDCRYFDWEPWCEIGVHCACIPQNVPKVVSYPKAIRFVNVGLEVVAP